MSKSGLGANPGLQNLWAHALSTTLAQTQGLARLEDGGSWNRGLEFLIQRFRTICSYVWQGLPGGLLEIFYASLFSAFSTLHSKGTSLPLTYLGLEPRILTCRLEQPLPLSGGPAQARSCPCPLLPSCLGSGVSSSPQGGQLLLTPLLGCVTLGKSLAGCLLFVLPLAQLLAICFAFS